MKERKKLSELSEGNTYEFWISSNIDKGGRFTGEITRIRTDYKDNVERMDIETENGQKIRFYWPNAHAEDITGGKVESIGQLTGVYPNS